MRDIDDRDAGFVAQPLQMRQDLGLARIVQRGERLVHQQQPGLGQQRTPDRNPLLFPSGKRSRPAGQEMADAQQVQHHLELGRLAHRSGHEPMPEEQVLSHGQMRKQPRLLEDVAEPAPMWRQHDALVRVDQGLAFHPHMSGFGADQPADDVDERSLA